MKYPLVISVLLVLSTSLLIGQENCNLDSIVIEMEKANYFKNSKIIMGPSSATTMAETFDNQYIRYESLKRCASVADLKTLVNHKNNVIVAYAWKAWLSEHPSEALGYLTKNFIDLSQKEFSNFLSYCQGRVTMHLDLYMSNELYDKLLSKEIELTSTEIVDFLNLKEKLNRKRAREQIDGF